MEVVRIGTCHVDVVSPIVIDAIVDEPSFFLASCWWKMAIPMAE
jgi:hypothetical protein